MNGWIKKFSDGSTEQGSDYDVINKKASWTRGRLTDIIGIEVHHEGHVLVIEGTGEFWQSDDMESNVGINHSSKIITRRIQKKISNTDFWLVSNIVNKCSYFKVHDQKPLENGYAFKRLIDNKIGKWLTLELDTQTGFTIFDFKENKI